MSGKGRAQMMQGWYQHSMAQQAREAQDDDEDDDDDEEEEEDEEASQNETIDYKEQYKRLKRKLRYLIYENECYQENLRNSRAKLLEVARDRSFLLDRLLQYEKVDISSSSESGEGTESSDGEIEVSRQDIKRRKLESSSQPPPQHTAGTSNAQKNPAPAKKKKPAMRVSKQNSVNTGHGSLTIPSVSPASSSAALDGHMTPEEVERHLSARGHSFMGLLPEKAPPTVPTEMFSNEPSLDSESNDLGDLETSPSNLGDDCLDMLGD